MKHAGATMPRRRDRYYFSAGTFLLDRKNYRTSPGRIGPIALRPKKLRPEKISSAPSPRQVYE
jgi:hypothetical protein